MIARWERVPRPLAGDGSCRPIWLALRRAAAKGRIEVLGSSPNADIPLGIRLTVHATKMGPRSAPVISETFVDGVIAAFHGPPPDPSSVAVALAPKLPRSSIDDLEQLITLRWEGNLFPRSPFTVTPNHVQVSPDDERLLAGEVAIAPDAQGSHVEISGELFTLRQTRRPPSSPPPDDSGENELVPATLKTSEWGATRAERPKRAVALVSTEHSPSKDSGMAARFHHRDQKYADWLSAHQHDGYVLNLAGGASRLHRASCVHLWRPIEEGLALTEDYPKVCSTWLQELRPMLGGGRACPTCAP